MEIAEEAVEVVTGIEEGLLWRQATQIIQYSIISFLL